MESKGAKDTREFSRVQAIARKSCIGNDMFVVFLLSTDFELGQSICAPPQAGMRFTLVSCATSSRHIQKHYFAEDW